MFERFQASDTLTVEDQPQFTLQQKLLFQLLDLNVIAQRLLRPAHIIAQTQVQVSDGQFALQFEFVRLQVAQIHKQWHNFSPI
jgi:hypothetical protein